MYPDENRSISSTERAYVRFENKTGKPVELIWLDFNGIYVKYKTLTDGEYYDVNTFKTHPWIALDAETKVRMHIGQSPVYFPKTTRDYYKERYPDKEIPRDFETRRRAYITLPVHRLKYAALLAVGKLMKDGREVEKLGLPKELTDPLKKYVVHRNIIKHAIDPGKILVITDTHWSEGVPDVLRYPMMINWTPD
ncbi:unnamed protein product [Acanthoscelides obtectus]|uniref:von Hippel-Lindau disease tumour suppressor beta domain-containing protein n=1 Tax=Acanthoscelides obtectus TaxID=200917 RepID=A0A9P0KYS8_ACAOB|nr:unnamed protein product [Acanthoscelides obtectus]CAK1666232.1 von Hippel-Lindau tumor suppressor homolog [Acanthoscelides obtectus]